MAMFKKLLVMQRSLARLNIKIGFDELLFFCATDELSLVPNKPEILEKAITPP